MPHRLALTTLALLLCAPVAAAQTVPFGKNKIQYRDFQWHVLSGEHVDVYYYPEEERIARMALAYAEESYEVLERRFRHHPFDRIPLIVYASHQHFEQTNVFPGLIPEGVLGFTEYLKRRVSLPFRGDYAQFRHTLRHELIHAFQISKIAEVRALHPGRERFTPQEVHWWTEGLAEYWSSEQDAQDAMFNRDLVLAGRVPDISAMTRQRSFASYPLGAELHGYLAGRFGEDYIVRMYEEFWKYDSFDDALAGVLGVDLDRLDTDWKRTLQRRFFPELGERAPPEVAAVPVVYGAGGNFKPALYVDPDAGDAHLFFLSARTGYTSLYRTPLDAGESGITRVLEGEKTAEFESLHPFDSRIDVHRSGVVAFVSKYLQRDALFVWDIHEQRVVGRYQWPDLVGLRSPAWNPRGDGLVFEGLSTGGYSDLYTLDFRTQQRTRLTADAYRDKDPDWSPDGGSIVFASDRSAFGADGYANLFLLDMSTGAVRPVTFGAWNDASPRWSRDGARIAFISDRAGTPDVYAVDRRGSGRRLTALTGGAFDPEWLPDDRGLVFTAYSEGGYRIYRLAFGEDTLHRPRIALRDGFPATPVADAATDAAGGVAAGAQTDAATGAAAPIGWRWRERGGEIVGAAEGRRYDGWRQISVDIAGGDAFVVPGLGAAQGVQFLASDMLGDHLLFGGASAIQAERISDLLDNFSGNLLYLNLSNRLNFGVGIFRFRGLYRDVALDLYEETTYGGQFVASYPFSRFHRLELHVGLERSDRRAVGDSGLGFLFGADDADDPDDAYDLSRSGLLASNLLSFVKDNTLWVPTGPIDGERYHISIGFSTCFSCRVPNDATGARAARVAAAERYVLAADYRRYFRTSLRSAYALRAYGFFSNGAIPARVVLGGPHRLRGYPRYSLAGSRAALLNQEWRFPIAGGFGLRLPWLGDVRLPGIEGALFADVGSSWLEDREPTGAWGSYGFGIRSALIPPIVLRLDLGRRFRIGERPPVDLGRDTAFGDPFVDLFFGYNY
ncbi:MAG TPA: hypothetical protein VF212_02610 [Longimicrobiales bacterium]